MKHEKRSKKMDLSRYGILMQDAVVDIHSINWEHYQTMKETWIICFIDVKVSRAYLPFFLFYKFFNTASDN